MKMDVKQDVKYIAISQTQRMLKLFLKIILIIKMQQQQQQPSNTKPF